MRCAEIDKLDGSTILDVNEDVFGLKITMGDVLAVTVSDSL